MNSRLVVAGALFMAIASVDAFAYSDNGRKIHRIGIEKKNGDTLACEKAIKGAEEDIALSCKREGGIREVERSPKCIFGHDSAYVSATFNAVVWCNKPEKK